MEVFKRNGVFRTVESMDGAYTDETFKEFLRSNADQGTNSEMLRWREQIEKSLNIRPMKEYKNQPIYKIVFVSPAKEQLTEPQQVLAADFEFCIQNKDACGFINGELVNRKFDKGKAVQRVCEYLHIPVSSSVAVGDSMNDKEMLEMAGLGICMENGNEELKKLADDICPSVKENGIRSAFLKYHLVPAGN